MKLNAVIINEEKKQKEKHWKWIYTFIDVDTEKKDYFSSRKKVNYTPDVIGKLKLIQDDNGSKFYQSFEQDEFKPFKSPIQLEKDIEKNVQKLDNYFSEKTIDFKPQQLLGILNTLHQEDKTWDKVADTRFGKTSRMLRYWRKWLSSQLINPTPEVPKKRGRKRIMEEDDFLLLLFLTNSPQHNTKTQQQKSDYIFEKTGHRYSQQVLSYNLKKYSELTGKRATKRYSEQNLEEIWNFLKKNSWLYSLPNCLAVDEFSVHPGETPRCLVKKRMSCLLLSKKVKKVLIIL